MRAAGCLPACRRLRGGADGVEIARCGRARCGRRLDRGGPRRRLRGDLGALPALAGREPRQAALGGRVPDLDDPLVDVDRDRLRPIGLAVGFVGLAVDVDAEPGADDDHAIALGADDERVSGLPVRHAEPHLAHLDPRRAVLEPHDARSAEHRLDAPFERQPARSGRAGLSLLAAAFSVPARRQLRRVRPEPERSGQHQRGGGRHAAGEPEPAPRARRQHRHGDRAPTPSQRHVVGAAQRRLVERAPQLGRDLVRAVGPAVLRGHRTLFLAIAISSARA